MPHRNEFFMSHYQAIEKKEKGKDAESAGKEKHLVML